MDGREIELFFPTFGIHLQSPVESGALSSGTREYIAVSFAEAKRLKKLERVTGNSNSPCFGSFAKQVDLAAIEENLDVLSTDVRDL